MTQMRSNFVPDRMRLGQFREELPQTSRNTSTKQDAEHIFVSGNMGAPEQQRIYSAHRLDPTISTSFGIAVAYYLGHLKVNLAAQLQSMTGPSVCKYDRFLLVGICGLCIHQKRVNI